MNKYWQLASVLYIGDVSHLRGYLRVWHIFTSTILRVGERRHLHLIVVVPSSKLHTIQHRYDLSQTDSSSVVGVSVYGGKSEV